MDCRVASLLAETVARLCVPNSSLRTSPCHSEPQFIANPTLSFRTPPRLCERSEAIHLANRTAPNHGLPRRYAPRRDSNASLRTPLRLCERSEAIHLSNHAALNHGLPRRYAPRRDSNASLRTPLRLCKRHPVFASAAKQSTSQTTRRSTMDCHVATLLAETALHRLPRPSASQRQKRVIANSTPSLRTPPRLCERSEAIHLANNAALNHGLPRRYTPRRDGSA